MLLEKYNFKEKKIVSQINKVVRFQCLAKCEVKLKVKSDAKKRIEKIAIFFELNKKWHNLKIINNINKLKKILLTLAPRKKNSMLSTQML